MTEDTMSDEPVVPLPWPPPEGKIRNRDRPPAWMALVAVAIITIGAVAALAATALIPVIFGVEMPKEGAAISTLSDLVLLGVGALAGVLGSSSNGR